VTVLAGLDLGSSGVKAVLVDPEKGIVASASYAVDLYSDSPGWAEADPEQWWRGVASTIHALRDQCPGPIAAVAVSGMVPAVVICDAQGRALRRALLQNDARATKEIASLRVALADVDLLGLTGSVLSQQSVAPTALWLATNEPELWARTHFVMGSYDWLAMRLGARPHVEQNWAIESGLYSLHLNPLAAVVDATGITWPELLPVERPGTPLGLVSAQAAQETGLDAGTLIVVGGADHVLSAYGAGLVEGGDALVKLGGAGDILAVSDQLFTDERLYLDAHPIEGQWLPNGCMATSGSILRWEQDLLGGADLASLDDEAQHSAPGDLLALPYFLGEKTPLHDPNLRGAVLGLHLGSSRGNLHRAFLEAIAYGFRSHTDVFAQRGVTLTSIRVTNGGSKSRLWREILASVLQRDLVSIINHPGASFGAAVLAGLGSGLIDDWAYVRGALEAGEIISPNPQHLAVYEERYQQFLQLSEVTTSLSHSLARSQL
jgi:xylulokinase